ncbi:MAG: hypothetical protein JWL63_863 [Rhodocyclales bacterium]|nr:hypothetical protein [Rhodocyclales bacterium]
MKTLTILSMLAALFFSSATHASAIDLAAFGLGALGILAVVFHRPMQRLHRRLTHGRQRQHKTMHA